MDGRLPKIGEAMGAISGRLGISMMQEIHATAR